MRKFTFGSLNEANQIRSAVGDVLAEGDDRRKRTVVIDDDAPERLVERLETEQFVRERDDAAAFGMSQLTDDERASLTSSTSFSWSDYGFGAMRAKAALEAKGATEWLDYYEPGEDVGGALENLEQSKKRAAETGASLGVGGDYVDDERTGRTQRRQVERAQSRDVERAIVPAFAGDLEAIGFLEEERAFQGGGLFDLSFGDDGPRGADYERLEEAHAQRSPEARRVDELKNAPTTRDPLTWARNPRRWDFPGVDTVEPDELHAQRSPEARRVDERELAPVPDDVETWAAAPDRYDWLGVDTPPGGVAPGQSVTLESGTSMTLRDTFTPASGDLWGRFSVEGDSGPFEQESPASEVAAALNVPEGQLFATAVADGGRELDDDLPFDEDGELYDGVEKDDLTMRERALASQRRGDRRGTLGAIRFQGSGANFGGEVAAIERREAAARRRRD